MCGIFAYAGSQPHAILKTLRGLRDLEYRGYDSWGVAVKQSPALFVEKRVGKISDVDLSDFDDKEGSFVIAHTRWATHGGVSEKNAHPHFNRDKTIAVVHNGIVENYRELQKEIKQEFGENIFRSETDTEVIPLLIDLYMSRGNSLERAFLEVCKRLQGRFAFVVLAKDSDFLLVARNGSPLVIGKGDGEYYAASDVPAFLEYTKTVNYLEDGEWARLSREGVSYGNFHTGKVVRKHDQESKWNKESATKQGWNHFMMKEIMEQKESLLNALLQENEEWLTLAAGDIKGSPDVTFIGCGTANHVGMLGEYVFAEMAKTKARAIHASEFARHAPFLTKNSVVIPITQSGETADVLEAIALAQEKGAKIISVLNARGSSAERASHYFFPINAGPEIAVASTKAATGQMIVLYLLAGIVSGKTSKEMHDLLKGDLQKLNTWLTPELVSSVGEAAKKIQNKEDLYVIGKGVLSPIALEAALKIKEVSYIHAEGFAAAELKHGTIALIEKGTPVVALVSDDAFREDVLSSAQETKARGAYIVGISSKNEERFDAFIQVPELKFLAPIAHTIASQVLAYHLAILRGNDPDRPRNLAKSVTVK